MLMKNPGYILVLCALSVITTQCGSKKNKIEMENHSFAVDPHSFSNPAIAVITHLNLNVDVDFEKQTLKGFAEYDIKTSPGAKEIIFDTKRLIISKITLDQDTTPAIFSTGIPDEFLGAPLVVKIKEITKKVRIYYETSPDADALQWMDPAQTKGGKHPFLYTQSQAILCRTWIPIQDSPGIRFTYNSTIQVPSGLWALMSAENPQKSSETGLYTHVQSKPIPAYLMALAVGNLAFHKYDDKTGVYAEPEMMEASVYEFTDTHKMLESAEKLYGPYDWGRFDVLVLPPSFPFGGMENPCLTFATPTIIAGDKSLVSLIAHELAHSWSGNLVTNKTWNDFWLNEGFTVYLERRIMEELEGKSYADMLAVLGYSDLKESMADMMQHGQENDTKLKLDLEDRDPDDGMTDIAYEKGYLLLISIENAVGRPKFDAFVKKWFSDKGFKGADTEEFLVYLQRELMPKDSEAYKQVNPEKWIYQAGLPEHAILPHSERFESVKIAAEKAVSLQLPVKEETKNWSSHEWTYFLRSLPEDKLNAAIMSALDDAYHFSQASNNEILFVWLMHSVKIGYADAFPSVDKFLNTVGRRKFVKPLYEAMMKNPATVEMAKEIYAKSREGYHAVTYQTIDKIVK